MKWSQHKVIEIRIINQSVYVVRMERGDFQFVSGQTIAVRPIGESEDRPYSIYSGENEHYIEILVKEVTNGNLSEKMKLLKDCDIIDITEPYGHFLLPDNKSNKFIFIATGTGISPFHSFVKTNKGLNYNIIHGISKQTDLIELNDFEKEKIIPCISKEKTIWFNGRVSEYLTTNKIDKDATYYLCGNYEMIDDVKDILLLAGIKKELIKTEGYF